MVKHWEKVIMKLFLVLVSMFVVTFGRHENCGCDHKRRVIKCSRMDLTDLKENNIICRDFENMDISQNNLFKFPNNLRQFKSVNISGNSLKNLDVAVNQNTEFLDVSRNNLIAINLKENFRHLRHLDASKNTLGFGKENFLEGYCNLIHLDLSENLVTSLLSVTKCSELSVLLAADNVISDLSENLSTLTNLKTLNLARNKLLYANILPPNLETLDISGNRITRINSGMFRGLVSLTFLNLDGNKIKNIEPGTFSKLVSLETLKLNTDDLMKLKSEMFQGLKSLKVLELCFNLIVKVSDDTFSDLPALETLMLASNQIIFLPALRLGKNVKVVQLMWNYIKRLNLQALMTMFSGSAVPRRVSFPMNEIQSDDREWTDVVNSFTWECVEWKAYLISQYQELPPDNYTHNKEPRGSLGGLDCACVKFTDRRGMTFDTCVVDTDKIDGLHWIDAVGMSRGTFRFPRDDL